MIAFFTQTSYQIITAINIKLSEYPNEKADIYVMTTNGRKDHIENGKKARAVFDNVYFCDIPFYNYNRFKFITAALFDKSLSNMISKHKYDRIFCSIMSINADYIYAAALRANSNVKFNHIEDGLGEYVVDVQYKDTKLFKLCRFLGRYNNPYVNVEALWVYQPNACIKNTQYPMQQIPPLQGDVLEKLKATLAAGITVSLPTDCKLIYFDQPFLQQQGFDIDDRHILSLISSYVPKENIYVKLHPGTIDKSRYEGYKILPKIDCPWEIALSFIDVEKITLVATSSTAVFTPKSIYDKEPNVILTCDTMPDVPFVNRHIQSEFFNKFKTLYKAPDRFMLPQSEQELCQCLIKIKENL